MGYCNMEGGLTTYEQAFAATMKNEGGYSNITGDRGGETYMGISRVFWPSWPGWLIIDDWKADHINAIARDAALTDHVRGFYRAQFWDRIQGDKVAEVSAPVALELFDTAVNCGVSRAVEFLQTAINMQNGNTYKDIAVDGKLGGETINTLRRCLSYQPGSKEYNEQILLNCMNGEQYIFYKKNPQHKRFRGWFRRC